MSDWISQFTSSYFSSIAYGLTVLVLTILFKPAYTWIGHWSKRLQETNRAKLRRNVILPTEQETRSFSKKQKPTDNEWKEAVAFLRNETLGKLNPQSQTPTLSKRIFLYFDKNTKAYRYTLIASAILNIIFVLSRQHNLQFLTFILSVMLAAWMVFLLVVYTLTLAIERHREKARFANLKAQIRDAVNVIAPGIVFTYDQLGECLKDTSEQDLPDLQSELSDMGFRFSLKDMKIARFLATAPENEIIEFGQGIVTNVEELNDLSAEEKKEAVLTFVDIMRYSTVPLNE